MTLIATLRRWRRRISPTDDQIALLARIKMPCC